MLTLALGIGSAVVMVDILDRLLLRAPAGVTDPNRVARVYFGNGDAQILGELCSYAKFESLAGVRDSLDAIAAYFNEQLTLGRGERARQLQTVAVTSEYFAALGVTPYLGSWPARTSDRSAVISYGLWRQEFGGAPDVVGKTVRLGLDTYDIAAVAPRGFAGIDVKAADVWLPFEPRARYGCGQQWKEMAFSVRVVARIRPGINRSQLNDRASALRAQNDMAPWERSNRVVFGDLRAARAPGAALGTRVEVLIAGMSILVLLITFCAVAAFLFGLAPAFRLTTRRALSPGHSAAVRPSRMLDLFSGFQVALTLPLIVGAGLFVLSLWGARHQDFGMENEHVVVLSTNLYETGRPMENHAVHRAMQASVARLPGVEATAVVQSAPLTST